jgi:hypothetical protein
MRVRQRSLGRALGFVLAGASLVPAMGPRPAEAGQSDCTAINGGSLNLALGDEQVGSRRVRLEAGDKLTFQFQTSDGSFGTVALLKGDTHGRLLLVGPAGTNAAFVAPESGAFDFRFARDGTEAATFRAACVPAHTAHRAQGRVPQVAGLPQSGLEEAHDIEVPALGEVAIDPGWPTKSEGRPAAPVPAVVPKDPDTGLAFKMEPRDQSRVTTGLSGLQLDPAETGVNVGVNYKLQPAIMVGALAQLDQSGDAMAGPSPNLAQHGWMAGPTAKVQFAPGLSLDAQAAWGQADSGDIDVVERGPSLPRKAVSAKLSSTQTAGAWRFTPSLSVNRSWDTVAVQDASATDMYLTTSVASGRVAVGPEIAYRLDLANAAFLEPRIAVGSFWGLDAAAGPALHAGLAEMRLKAEAGVTLGVAGGTKFQLGATVEEGTASTPDAWSGRLQMSVPLK